MAEEELSSIDELVTNSLKLVEKRKQEILENDSDSQKIADTIETALLVIQGIDRQQTTDYESMISQVSTCFSYAQEAFFYRDSSESRSFGGQLLEYTNQLFSLAVAGFMHHELGDRVKPVNKFSKIEDGDDLLYAHPQFGSSFMIFNGSTPDSEILAEEAFQIRKPIKSALYLLQGKKIAPQSVALFGLGASEVKEGRVYRITGNLEAQQVQYQHVNA